MLNSLDINNISIIGTVMAQTVGQGLTLVHFSAQCEHVLLDTLGA